MVIADSPYQSAFAQPRWDTHRLNNKVSQALSVSRWQMFLICKQLIIAAWHFFLVCSLNDSWASSQALRYLISVALSTKSPLTLSCITTHLLSCILLPKYINSVFGGFIFSLTWSIHVTEHLPVWMPSFISYRFISILYQFQQELPQKKKQSE